MEPLDLSATALADHLRRGGSTVTEHIDAVFARIAERDHKYSAFSALRDEARDDARRLDAMPSHDRERLPLFGVPLAVKEEIDVEGMVTTLGGRGNSSPASEDSEVVAQLRGAGAIVVGKTHMPEFGQAPYTDGAWGETRNPYNLARSPGGSSGGSGVAVAARMVPIALGGDGGGSVRIPAAWNGIVGLKPSRGLVSLAPQEHLWFRLGTYGPLARTVEDVSLLTELLAPDAEPLERPATLRVGWTLDASVPGMRPEPQLAAAVEAAAARLSDEGAHVTHGSFHWGAPTSTLAFLMQDWFGIQEEVASVEHPERLEPRSRQTANHARFIPRAALRWAIRQSDRLEQRTGRLFQDIDILLAPVTPMLPPPTPTLHDKHTIASQLGSTSGVSHTAYWNMAGNPAASVPVGLSKEGLPLAVQVIGNHGKDHLVLDVARRLFEELTPPGV